TTTSIVAVDAPHRVDEQIQSSDTAFKDLETLDYVVGQAWARVGFGLSSGRPDSRAKDWRRSAGSLRRQCLRSRAYPRSAESHIATALLNLIQLVLHDGAQRPYSLRRATAGSTRIARSAGIRHPRAAATASTNEIITNVAGSAGETCTSSDFRI